MPSTILIVDDEETQLITVARLLARYGFETELARNGDQALSRLMDTEKPAIDLVLLDIYMPKMDGKEALSRIRAIYPSLPVIILTASNKIEDAVELMKLGASDFITKPTNGERLRLSINQHLTIRTLSRELARIRRKEDGQGQFTDLISAGGGLATCVALGKRAANSDIPVLITGESGVGKELLARAIHGEGHRDGRAFVAINCGAIPDNLIESILFGHEKGSFTGAIAREIGKFREAEGGTLFLDEIGKLKSEMQMKLLRVLQQKEVQPVGAGKSVKVNVRIISATNRNLVDDVASGRFREDLYYRLNVLPIHIPALKNRHDDIPDLVSYILAKFCATENKFPKRVNEQAMQWLTAQSWPGNVRQLENLLYRTVVLTDHEELTEQDFIKMRQSEQKREAAQNNHYVTLLGGDGKPKKWDDIEMEVIAATMERLNDNIPETARLLGIGQSTLYKKLADKI